MPLGVLFCCAGRLAGLLGGTCRSAGGRGQGACVHQPSLCPKPPPPPACPCLQRLLELLRPERVHILERGRVARSGGMELVERLEAGGYAALVA